MKVTRIGVFFELERILTHLAIFHSFEAQVLLGLPVSFAGAFSPQRNIENDLGGGSHLGGFSSLDHP